MTEPSFLPLNPATSAPYNCSNDDSDCPGITVCLSTVKWMPADADRDVCACPQDYPFVGEDLGAGPCLQGFHVSFWVVQFPLMVFTVLMLGYVLASGAPLFARFVRAHAAYRRRRAELVAGGKLHESPEFQAPAKLVTLSSLTLFYVVLDSIAGLLQKGVQFANAFSASEWGFSNRGFGIYATYKVGPWYEIGSIFLIVTFTFVVVTAVSIGTSWLDVVLNSKRMRTASKGGSVVTHERFAIGFQVAFLVLSLVLMGLRRAFLLLISANVILFGVFVLYAYSALEISRLMKRSLGHDAHARSERAGSKDSSRSKESSVADGGAVPRVVVKKAGGDRRNERIKRNLTRVYFSASVAMLSFVIMFFGLVVGQIGNGRNGGGASFARDPGGWRRPTAFGNSIALFGLALAQLNAFVYVRRPCANAIERVTAPLEGRSVDVASSKESLSSKKGSTNNVATATATTTSVAPAPLP